MVGPRMARSEFARDGAQLGLVNSLAFVPEPAMLTSAIKSLWAAPHLDRRQAGCLFSGLLYPALLLCRGSARRSGDQGLELG